MSDVAGRLRVAYPAEPATPWCRRPHASMGTAGFEGTMGPKSNIPLQTATCSSKSAVLHRRTGTLPRCTSPLDFRELVCDLNRKCRRRLTRRRPEETSTHATWTAAASSGRSPPPERRRFRVHCDTGGWQPGTARPSPPCRAIARALDGERDRFAGFAILVDGHWVPISAAARGEQDPGSEKTRRRVVPGDRDGTSCSPSSQPQSPATSRPAA